MEYFKIETEEELKQAYEQLKWDSSFSLEDELYFFNKDSLFRCILKNRKGNHSLVSDSDLCPLSDVEIPNPLKSKNKMEYFKIETEEELKQAYEQLKWDSSFSLEQELNYFNKYSLFRIILKDREGNHSLTEESDLCPLSDVEIPNPLKSNKYNVKCKGVEIDVYDVLKSFDVQCPATQHAIKKLLKTGKRGHKDAQQDLTEAIESINRAKELRNE